MSIQVTNQSGQAVYKLNEYIVDYRSDIINLPTAASEVAVGSTAFCIETGEAFMLNTQRIWQPIGESGGSSGGSSGGGGTTIVAPTWKPMPTIGA